MARYVGGDRSIAFLCSRVSWSRRNGCRLHELASVGTGRGHFEIVSTGRWHHHSNLLCVLFTFQYPKHVGPGCTRLVVLFSQWLDADCDSEAMAAVCVGTCPMTLRRYVGFVECA